VGFTKSCQFNTYNGNIWTASQAELVPAHEYQYWHTHNALGWARYSDNWMYVDYWDLSGFTNSALKNYPTWVNFNAGAAWERSIH